MNRISILHLWVGKTGKSQKEFDKYFNQSQAFMFDSDGREKNPEEIVLSQFSTDIGLKTSFDEDFLTIYFAADNDSLDETLMEVEDSPDFENIKKACSEKGIDEANAMFFYTDIEIEISNSNEKYNDLTYIGKFQSPY